jgi:hypothetical protein
MGSLYMEANTLNKQSRTADKGRFSSFEVGYGAYSSSLQHITKYYTWPRSQLLSTR